MRDEALYFPVLARVSLKFPSVKNEGAKRPQVSCSGVRSPPYRKFFIESFQSNGGDAR